VTATTWERIQLVIRLRSRDGASAPPPDAFRLQDDELDELRMAPTRGWTEGSDTLLRFNVMQGHSQMPLEDGRWVLQVIDGEHPDGVPACVALATPDGTTQDATFQIGRGTYTVAIEIDASGALSILVGLDQSTARRRGGIGPPTPTRLRKRYYRRSRRRLFPTIYRLLRLFARRNGHRVLFTSDSRAEIGGNLKEIHDRMVERGLDRTYELRQLFRPSILVTRTIQDRILMPWRLARADVVLIDDYQPAIYRVDDPDARIIQLWHASGAFKTVGYSRVGKPGGPSPYSRVHKNYTHAIVSSDYDVPFYAEAFGLPEERVVPTGIPRMDRFFDEEKRQAGRAAALDAFPLARGKTTILFAPTFRGGTRTAYYDTDRLDLPALHALCVEKDAVVIFKMHPFVLEPLDIPVAFRDRLIDGTDTPIDVNDLLFVVDLLITDYSSIVFEYSTLGGPMLFFGYDLEEYIRDRDFYVPFEEFVPGRIVHTFEELIDAIRREDYEADKVPAFAAQHFAHLDGSSTDRVIDELILAR
jgi:CDP-ribitol ribitolphosphotransferase